MTSIPGVLQRYKVDVGRRYPVLLAGDTEATRALIFVGGLFDMMGSVAYLPKLAQLCQQTGWTIAMPHLSSSDVHWGSSTLKQDAIEIEAVVRHLRGLNKSRIVIMGHSTGCQDVMAYLLSEPALTIIDGAILQAPVSDRQAFCEPKHVEAGKVAEQMVNEGRGDESLPREHAAAFSFPGVSLRDITAYRCWSLICVGGDDDFFSSDIPSSSEEAKAIGHRPLSDTFGKLPPGAPLLFLMSGADQYVPASVDKAALLDKWRKACREGVLYNGEIVEGATHAVEDKSKQDDMMEIIRGFIVELQSKL